MATYRILITGSRDWTDVETIAAAISMTIVEHNTWMLPVVIVHGGARGADSIAGGFANHPDIHNVTEEVHPADWDGQGKKAGFVRNAEMVAARADVCLAFIRNDSKGATMCANLAKAAGIPTKRYTQYTDKYIDERRGDRQ